MSETLGRVVRRGRIRVDARKAMAKLREHLLVDLHLYAIEVVRAAVLAGATRIDVQHDADDVVITFDGTPLEAAALPHLFEHLTGEAGDEPTRHLRLLALAVNAALGLAPAWVALTSAEGGEAARVVWTPALVAAIERDEKPLPTPEIIPLPAGMPASGTRFHLRRKVGWEVVRRAAAKTAPREVVLLTEASHCLHVPLFVNGAPPPPSSRPAALARAAISLPGVRGAFVEIHRKTSLAPHIDFCELGILLARTSFSFGSHFPMAEHLGVSPPVRLIVDADALPTNASRSAVREDAPLFGTMTNVAAPALTDAIAGIVATVLGSGSVPEGVTVDASDPEALHDALGAFLCAAEASLIGGARLPEALRALLDLPLFRDGLGRPLTHTGIPREDPLLVWQGTAPLPAEMTPWAHQIVWRRGRVAERVFEARKVLEPEQLAKLAKLAVSRRNKMLALPSGSVTVPDEPYLVRGAFHITEGTLAGLDGEVAVAADPAAYVRNLGLRVFIENRCYEALPLPEAVVPLPCVVALQWPGHIAPKLAYEGIASSKGFHAALAFAVRHAVLLCERFAAERLTSGEPFEATSAAVLRAALATAVLAPERLFSVAGFEMPGLAELPSLVSARVWPSTEGGFVSLHEVCGYAAKTGGFCVATLAASGRAADGRPVVRGSSGEIEWLAKCLKSSVAIVHYDRALPSAGSTSSRAVSRAAVIAFVDAVTSASRMPVLQFQAQGMTCTVTAGSSETRVWHGGVELVRTLLDERFGGVTVAIDDDSIVPNATWDGVLFAADQTVIARAERLYAERVVAALQGDEQARGGLFQALSGPFAGRYEWPENLKNLPPEMQRLLIDRAGRGLAADASDDERDLAARIDLLPFLWLIGERGDPVPASLGDVARHHPRPQKIPYLRAAPPFKPLGWHPLIVRDDRVLDALARWSGDRLDAAGDELLAHERAAAREQDHARFRRRPTLDPALVGAQGDTSNATVHLPANEKHGLHGVAAALPHPDVEITSALVEVLFEDRLVGTQSLPTLLLPVVARVSVLDRDSLEGFEQLSQYGLGGVGTCVERAALQLALRLLELASTPGASSTFFRNVRALRLVFALLSHEQTSALLDRALRGGSLPWPTVQGGERPYNHLRLVDGALWAGTITYASWLPPAGPETDLDRPILHVAPSDEGSLLVGILEKLGVKVRPVSDAIVTLQGKRARGGSDKPRLSERPVHALLAQDLLALGVSGMEGEVALYESGESVAELSSLDGESRRLLLELSFPVRAVARLEVFTTSALPVTREQLERAAVRLLLGLLRHLDELPPFVRAHVRSLICRALSKGREIPPAARAVAVFADIDGAWCSLQDLQAEGHPEWSCTFDPPPYARARQDGRTLVLTPTEHLQLHGKIEILNVTEWLRRDLEAERRRDTPPLEIIALDAALGTAILGGFALKKGPIEGEIALLQPWAAERRGLHVHTTRRPLCTIDDGPGWPLVAVVNDDSLHPTRWFDQLPPGEETALRANVREHASRHARDFLGATLPPAAEMCACVFLDQSLPPVAAYGSTDPMHLTGYVYLPSIWPISPTMRLFVQGAAAPDERAVSLASAAIAAKLPIGGALLVAHDSPALSNGGAYRLALALRAVAERLLAPLLEKTPGDPVVRTYHWNLRLIGCTALGEPTVSAADGRALTAEAVISALHDRGEIWLTDRQGSIDGAFPKSAPPFVLLDDDSPLVRVLRARVPREKLHKLGAFSAAQAIDPASSLFAPLPPPALAMVTSAAAVHEGATSEASAPGALAFNAAEAQPSASPSWLASAFSRVSSLFGGSAPRVDQSTGLGEAVERALRALRLRDEPVIIVREVGRGKLVRYDKRRRELSINIAHQALARHVAAPSPTAMRRACIALVAAAVSEVNIALENVTDHDEQLALLELLRQEAAAGTAPK